MLDPITGRLLCILFALGFLLATGSRSSSDGRATGSEGDGTLSVVAIDEEELPIAAGRIEIRGPILDASTFEEPAGSPAFGLTTDSDGRASLYNVPAGTYYFAIERDEYVPVVYPRVEIAPHRTTTVEVVLMRQRSYSPGPLSVCDYDHPRARARCLESAKGASERHADLLERMDEPALESLATDPGFEGYRFIWRRSFDEPVIISLARIPGATPSLVTKVLSRVDGNELGDLIVSEARLATPAELQEARDLISELSFWELPREIVRIGDWGAELICSDGATWVIEVAQDGHYHHVDRHCPDEGSAVRRLGLTLIELSGRSFGHVY